MEERFFGLTLTDVRRLAYQLAERNGLQHRFNKEKQVAGKKWLYAFLKRNSTITLRQPEPTSYARATGFNRPAVNKFFDLLSEILTKHKIDASTVYNCDESGMKTVQQQMSKVLAAKGRRQVGSLTSAERGKNVTVVCAVNACGNYIPPFFIFPRKRMNPMFMDRAPPMSVGNAQENGWMTMQLFRQYLEHFVKFAHPTREKPVLLILDGHCSHTKSIEVLDYATEQGVVMLSLPPHTTHRLQPLDVAFFKPLQTYYDQFIARWLRQHPGRTFTEYQVGEAFTEAYGKAATVAIASHGFEKCGIWPYNRDIFGEHDFAPSVTTDRPMHEAAHVAQDHPYSAVKPVEPTAANPVDVPVGNSDGRATIASTSSEEPDVVISTPPNPEQTVIDQLPVEQSVELTAINPVDVPVGNNDGRATIASTSSEQPDVVISRPPDPKQTDIDQLPVEQSEHTAINPVDVPDENNDCRTITASTSAEQPDVVTSLSSSSMPQCGEQNNTLIYTNDDVVLNSLTNKKFLA